MNNTVYPEGSNAISCINLPDVAHSYCGITTTWVSRISSTTGIIFIIILSSLALVVAIVIIKHSKARYRYVAQRMASQENRENERDPLLSDAALCTRDKYTIMVYLFAQAKVLLDVADLVFDIILFYQLERGGLIDNRVIRNTNVNNSILVFGVLGLLKMIGFAVCVVFFREKVIAEEIRRYQIICAIQIYISFCVEDGPELILEYFYIEKYISVKPHWYILLRDVIFLLLMLNNLKNIVMLKTWGTIFGSINCFVVSMLLIVLIELLRVVGAMHKYKANREMHEACFAVQNGRLVQTPFAYGCMSVVDYLILIVYSILAILLMILVCKLLRRSVNNRVYDLLTEFV